MNHWHYKPFETLKLEELYQILQLRSEVFVKEQNCIYVDMDNKDQKATHIFHKTDYGINAYCRVFKPGIIYENASIGRVLTSGSQRKMGFGKKLIENALLYLQLHYPLANIQISAQHYLLNFYKEFGFQQKSDIYLEDKIPHIVMLKTK